MLSWPMMGIGFVVNLTQKGQAAMSRMQEIFAAQPKVQDVAVAKEDSSSVSGEIEFRELSFTYPGAENENLKNISLHISPGQIVAVVGTIGSGKTTLAQLIPRLYDTAPDTLFIGGHPIREIPLPLLRQHIGYVDQEPFLFSATIRENIALGRSEASDEEIDDVVRRSGLLPDLDWFPDGLETVVGERGVSLSGGQKQRIALARALLVHPSILVLDDAFSSLDAETEKNILGDIREFTRNTTTVIISHRFSAIRDADRIVMMDDGRIVEEGTHDELIRLDGEYARTYKNQVLAMEMRITLQ